MRAEAALLGVTLMWGMTFPLIRQATADVGAFAFVAARFALATVLLAPLLWHRRQRMTRGVGSGIGLGVLAWSSYQAQTIGLSSVPAGRAAFITATSVIMVPLLAPFFRAGPPRRIDVLAMALATVGLYLLCEIEDTGIGLSSGDLWVLCCAFTYALYIHWLQVLVRRGHDHLVLVGQQVVTITVCALITLPFVSAAGRQIELTPAAIGAILFCACFATVLTFWLQARYQGRTTPHRTALIFTMEPVFAAIFAYLLLGESMSSRALVGAGLILGAILGAELIQATVAARSAPQRSSPGGEGITVNST